MALFNYATRELSAKIVYYGPGLSGKTTNIEMVHKLLRPEQKGRLISLPTETDRTLFFDFLPIDLGQIKGFKVRFHLYTVPGQVFYNATRRLVLQGVDGVVFVADSQREMLNSNTESIKNLIDNLSSYGKNLGELPFILQYNKRDLKNIMTAQEMDASLNSLHVPVYEAAAPLGQGVMETLVSISRLVFANLQKTLLMPGETVSKEEFGDFADDKIQKEFARQEEESLEEISDIEEIREEEEQKGAEQERGSELTSLQEMKPSSPPVFDELDEIEVEHSEPESCQEPTPPQASESLQEPDPHQEFEPLQESEPLQEPEHPQVVISPISVEAEGGELSFLRFESPSVSPEGHAILPALFLDNAGNSVRIRLRIAVDREPS